jgi:putative ubiquitin-RnfH superfamily antitoxin RatB of RatAB toxin-antitoxin module
MAALRIEVVYARASAQDVALVEVEEGARALDAIEASRVLARHPEIDASRLRLGRFGVEIRPGERVLDGDRIEILRPLVRGPMEARRLRARRKRSARKLS